MKSTAGSRKWVDKTKTVFRRKVFILLISEWTFFIHKVQNNIVHSTIAQSRRIILKDQRYKSKNTHSNIFCTMRKSSVFSPHENQVCILQADFERNRICFWKFYCISWYKIAIYLEIYPFKLNTLCMFTIRSGCQVCKLN